MPRQCSEATTQDLLMSGAGSSSRARVLFNSKFDCFTLCNPNHISVYAVTDSGTPVRRSTFLWPPDSTNGFISPNTNRTYSRRDDKASQSDSSSPDVPFQDARATNSENGADKETDVTRKPIQNDTNDEDSDSWLAVSQEQFDLEEPNSRIASVHLLEKSNILFATTYSGKSVYIYDDTKDAIVARLRFTRSIEAIVVRNDYLVTLATDALYVHRLMIRESPNTLTKIRFPLLLLARIPSITPRAPPYAPLIAVSDASFSAAAPFYVVVPSSKQCGFVVRLDLRILVPYLASNNSLQQVIANNESFKPIVRVPPSAVGIFHAHEGTIQAMTISICGTFIATASDRGTLIRVWDARLLQLLHEFRRGADIAIIHSLEFDTNACRLLVCSSKGTIHLFACRDLTLAQSCATPVKKSETPTATTSARRESEKLQAVVTPLSRDCRASSSLGTPASAQPRKGSQVHLIASAPPSSSRSRNPKSSLSFLAPLLPSYFASKWSYATFRFPLSQEKNIFEQPPSFKKKSLRAKIAISTEFKQSPNSASGVWLNATFLPSPVLEKSVVSEKILAISSGGQAVIFEYDATSMPDGTGKIIAQWALS